MGYYLSELRQLLDGLLQRVHLQVGVTAMDLSRLVAGQLHPQFSRNPGIGKGTGERMVWAIIFRPYPFRLGSRVLPDLPVS